MHREVWGVGAMPIIFHLPKKNSALVHIRNVVRHRMVFPSFRSHVFSCVGAVRIQKKLPTNYNNMSVLMSLKFRFPKIGINCITFKMAIVSNVNGILRCRSQTENLPRTPSHVDIVLEIKPACQDALMFLVTCNCHCWKVI